MDSIPCHYDKDLHDYRNPTYVCECVSFIIALRSDDRDPLRLAYVHRYEPELIETARWIDACQFLDNPEYFQPVLIDIDAEDMVTMKKLSVYRPQQNGDSDALYVIWWATIHALSGIFEADVDGDVSESEDDVIY